MYGGEQLKKFLKCCSLAALSCVPSIQNICPLLWGDLSWVCRFSDSLRFPAASVNREALIDLLLYYLIESTLHPNCMWAGGVWYSVVVISLCGTGGLWLQSILWHVALSYCESMGSFAGRAYSPSAGTGLYPLRVLFWFKYSTLSDLLGRSVSISTQYLLCHSGYLADYQLLPDSSSFSWRG